MEQRDLEEVIVLNIGYKNEYCCFFPCYEIFMGKPMDSSCDVDYHRVELHGKETAILWDDDGKLFLWNGLPTKGA